MTTSVGNFLHHRHMTRRHRGVIGLPRHAVQAVEHAPAGRQRVVDVHGVQKRIDGLRRLLQHHKTQSALLVEPAEARMMLLQSRQCSQGVGNTAEIALRDGRV